jgi:hypothetical protein
MGVVPESVIEFTGNPVGFHCDVQGDGSCHVHIQYRLLEGKDIGGTTPPIEIM